MELWTGIQRASCLSIWTLFNIACGNFTKFHVDDAKSGIFCLADPAYFDVLVVNLLRCLETCSKITECGAAIYDSGSRACYRLPDGYQYKGCTSDLVGAKIYRKGCPSGWKSRHKSCYRFTDQVYTNRSDSEALCKGFSDDAHLADIKTEEEYEFIRNWYLKMYSLGEKGVLLAAWIGATNYSGWTWSDGTTADFWPSLRIYGNGPCAYIGLQPSANKIYTDCEQDSIFVEGLCELDIF